MRCGTRPVARRESVRTYRKPGTSTLAGTGPDHSGRDAVGPPTGRGPRDGSAVCHGLVPRQGSAHGLGDGSWRPAQSGRSDSAAARCRVKTDRPVPSRCVRFTKRCVGRLGAGMITASAEIPRSRASRAATSRRERSVSLPLRSSARPHERRATSRIFWRYARTPPSRTSCHERRTR